MSTLPTVCMALYSFEVGGSERLGVRLVRSYLDHGMNVVCCGTRRGEGPLAAQLRDWGVPCLALDLEGRSRVDRWRTKRALRTWFEGHGVEAVHAQHFCVLSDIYASAVAANATRRIVTEHSAQPILDNRKYARTTKFLTRGNNCIVAINDVVRSAICKVSGVDDSKVFVIQNGINTDRFAPRERSEDGVVRIVWLGRLHPDKDVLTGLRAFREAEARCNRSLRLLVIGDGEERRLAEAFVEEYAMASLVEFAGEVADPAAALRNADIYLLSSRTEGTPLAMLEAMSCSLPVVATSVGGIPEIVTNAIGRLADVGNAELLAQALVELAEDRQLRLSLGTAARQVVEDRYTERQMTERYIHLLTDWGLTAA